LQRAVSGRADVKTITLQPVRRRPVAFEHADLEARYDKAMRQTQAPGSCADDRDVEIVVHGGGSEFWGDSVPALWFRRGQRFCADYGFARNV
jgi:hypothetical protein